MLRAVPMTLRTMDSNSTCPNASSLALTRAISYACFRLIVPALACPAREDAVPHPAARATNHDVGGVFIVHSNDLSAYTEMSTGVGVSAACSAVFALKSLQNAMMFTPCCPSAGPTGGDGFAAPAGTTNRTSAIGSFFAAPATEREAMTRASDDRAHPRTRGRWTRGRDGRASAPRGIATRVMPRGATERVARSHIATADGARAHRRARADERDDASMRGGGGAGGEKIARALGGGALASAPDGAFVDGDATLVVVARDRLRAFDGASGRARKGGRAAGGALTCARAAPERGGRMCVAGSASGGLSIWDCERMKLVRSYELPCAIYDVAYPGGECGRDAVFASTLAREDGGGRVHRVSLSKGKIVERLGKTNAPCKLVSSASGAFLACAERRTIYVWGVGKERSSRALRIHHTKGVTALAFSQDDEILACGDSSGRIVMWHGFARAVKKLQKEAQGEDAEVNGDALPSTTHHWHSRAVGCLHFSGDGAHLFSGGEEAVLVVWNIKDGTKTYLPRLGAPLTKIIPRREDPSRLALFAADNAVRLVNVASMSVEGTIQGIRPTVLDANASAYASVVAYDPRADALAFSAAGAALQFFDYARDEHIADLAVAPRNYVNTSGEVDAPMEPHVAHAAFSRDGRVLMTVDRRSDQPSHVTRAVEETLKIWERIDEGAGASGEDGEEGSSNVPGGAFTCVTQCDIPHKGLITCVGVRPSAHTLEDSMAFTAGAEGEVKIWVPNGRVSRGGEHAGWRCRSSATHPSGSAIACGAFSPDGSILATAGSEIILWDPKTNAKLATLTMPKTSEQGERAQVKAVAFIAGQPLFAAADGNALVVWNLQTLQPHRVYAAACVGLYSHPSEPMFAAVFERAIEPQQHKVAVVVRFVGAEATPDGTYACPDGAPETVVFPPADRAARDGSPSSTPMLVVTRDRQIVRVGSETNREARARDDMDVNAAAVTKSFMGGVVVTGAPVTPALKEALAEAQMNVRAMRLSVEGEDEDDVPARDRIIGGALSGVGKMPWGALFDAPSHELPPLTTLCPRFMDAMLVRQANPNAE